MERYVVYNSTIGYQYFTVDEKSSRELDKYIQIRSVVDTNVALVVPKYEVKEPTEKDMESINKIIVNIKQKEQTKKIKAIDPEPKEKKYTNFTGADLRLLMRKNGVGFAKLARACGYSSPSSIQSAAYRVDRPVTTKLWNRVLYGLKKLKEEEKAKAAMS